MNKTICALIAVVVSFLSARPLFAQTEDLTNRSSFYRYTFSESHPHATGNVYVDVYPTELYIGDPIYFVYYSKNEIGNSGSSKCYSELPISEFSCRHLYVYAESFADYVKFFSFDADKKLSSRVSLNKYTLRKEIPDTRPRKLGSDFKAGFPTYKELYSSNAKRVLWLTYLETPTLEDIDHPFWRDVSDAMTSEGVIVEMTLPNNKTVELRFHGRPDNEESILQSLKTNLRSNEYPALLPPYEFQTVLSYSSFKPPRDDNLPEGSTVNYKGANNDFVVIESDKFQIGDSTYCPGWFVRTGARKIPNGVAIRNLETIRRFETGLAPSAWRDEIQFIRMKMEVYSASSERERREATRRLIDWLFTLPPTQRVVMLRANPVCDEDHFCPNPPGYLELDKKLRSFSDEEALKEVE